MGQRRIESITVLLLIAAIVFVPVAQAEQNLKTPVSSQQVDPLIQENWDPITPEEAGNLSALLTLAGEAGSISAIDFSPAGDRLAAGSLGGGIQVWSIPEGELVFELDGHRAGVLTLDYSSDGSMLVSGGYDRKARLWDMQSGEMLKQVDTIFDGYILKVAFEPDGKRFALSDNACATELRIAPSGILDQTLPQPTCISNQGSVASWGLDFSPDGETLITGEGRWCCGGSLQSWSVDDPFEPPTLLEGNRLKVRSLEYSGDGDMLGVALLGSPTFWLVDPETGALIRTFNGHDFRVNSLDFGVESNLIASAGRDLKLKLWNVESGEELGSYFAHQDAINDLQFSPDGSLLATASSDGTVKLWGIE